MEEKRPEKRLGRFGRVLAISIALHLVVAAIFIVRLPIQSQPQPEEAVNVDLVPPPEDKQQDEKQPDQKQADKKQEQQKEAEKAPTPPPPPPPAQQPEKSEGQPPPPAPQQKAEKPPEPPKPPEKAPEPPKPPEPPKEEAKAEEPPKAPEKAPEPPKPPEQAKPPEQPKEEAMAQEPPKPEDKQPDPPPPPKQEEAKQQPEPSDAVGPLINKFGDKDSGPRKSLDGDASDDSSVADTTDNTDAGGDGDGGATGESAADVDEPAKPDEQAQAANPVAKDINLPQVDVHDVHSENDGPASEGDGSAKTGFAAEKQTDDAQPSKNGGKPGSKNAGSAGGQAGSGPALRKAKKLFSREATSDFEASTAMAGASRGMRFGTLCYSELYAQLSHSLGHQPMRVPRFMGGSDNTLTVGRGAFQDADSGWRYVSFKCEVDSDATKIVSFSFGTGGVVPRSEWKSLRITGN